MSWSGVQRIVASHYFIYSIALLLKWEGLLRSKVRSKESIETEDWEWVECE